MKVVRSYHRLRCPTEGKTPITLYRPFQILKGYRNVKGLEVG